MNLGQQVREYGPAPGAGSGALPVGRCVTFLGTGGLLARSSTTICGASWPPGPGPISVKAIQRPFGLKGIGGERSQFFQEYGGPSMKSCGRLKLRSRLGGPRRRGGSRPSERTKNIPSCSGDNLDGATIENS